MFDDFSDLNDTANPAWTHLSGMVGSTGQTWDASTGQYRLTAPTNGTVPPAPQFNGYGFVGSHTSGVYTNVEVRADFTDFSKGAFGVAARLNGLNGLNQLQGYGYAYDPQHSEMVIYQFSGFTQHDISSHPVVLDPNKDYTLILSAQGTQLHARMLEIGGGIVADQTAVSAAWASGRSGVYGYNHISLGNSADFTVDNFQTRVPEPATALLLAGGALAMVVRRRSRDRH